MKLITLTQDKFAQVDDANYDQLMQYSWFAIKQSSNRYYAINNECRMHRMIMGVTDPKIYVDHINGNGLDNQRNNLRIVTPGQNCSNRRKTKPSMYSRYKGVYKRKSNNKWIWSSRCSLDNIEYSRNAETEIEAAALYNIMSSILHKEYGICNDIEYELSEDKIQNTLSYIKNKQDSPTYYKNSIRVNTPYGIFESFRKAAIAMNTNHHKIEKLVKGDNPEYYIIE